MFHGKQSGRLITPIGKNDSAFKLAKTTGWPVAIGKLKKEGEFKAGDLVTFGSMSLSWAGVGSSETDATKLRKLETPSKATKLTTANKYEFFALLENGETFGYAVPRTSSLSSYLLDDQVAVMDFSNPRIFNLGQWEDISVAPYWANQKADGSEYSAPVILRDTTKHLAAPKACEGEGRTAQLVYNSVGNGYTLTELDVFHDVRTRSFALGTGITIKKLMASGVISEKAFLYTSDGFYYKQSDDDQLYKISFPYGTIKNAWPVSQTMFFVQNTNDVLYSCNWTQLLQPSLASGAWDNCGKWDVKKITGMEGRTYMFLLTTSGELYYRGMTIAEAGLPFTPNIFVRIHEKWLFNDIESTTTSFMGIIKSAA